jgi:hypothetical protein
MALTIQQANLDAINQALGNPTLRVRLPDGRAVNVPLRGRTQQRRKPEEIRQSSGQTGSRVTLATAQARNGVRSACAAIQRRQRCRKDDGAETFCG